MKRSARFARYLMKAYFFSYSKLLFWKPPATNVTNPCGGSWYNQLVVCLVVFSLIRM